MYCKNCGKEIDDNANVCPNCGVSVNNKKGKKEKNGFAIVGFICSLTIILFIFGLIFGIVGLTKSSKLSTKKGMGLSIASIVISALTLLLLI